jgi:hypothetical protein
VISEKWAAFKKNFLHFNFVSVGSNEVEWLVKSMPVHPVLELGTLSL